MKRWLLSLWVMLPAVGCFAQAWSLSTNLAAYADFGTMSAEVGYALGRHWNAMAAVRYNPFTFTSDDGPMQNRQRSLAAGARYWPWHIYSGWWVGGEAQAQEYNRGGIRSPETREGQRYGAGLSGGYAYMLTPWLNLDVGVGFWGGIDRYSVYECPVCGLTLDKGQKTFLLPDRLMLALSFIF